MAKKVEEEEEAKAWTPAEPLEDEKDEEETQRVARASARRKFLEDQHLESLKKKGKKGDNGRSPLW
jgi:hypothetical protein